MGVRHPGVAADDVAQHPFGVAHAPAGLQGRGQGEARPHVFGRVFGQASKGGHRLDVAAAQLVDEAQVVEARRMAGQRAENLREEPLGAAQVALALALDGGVERLACALVVHGPVVSRSRLEAL